MISAEILPDFAPDIFQNKIEITKGITENFCSNSTRNSHISTVILPRMSPVIASENVSEIPPETAPEILS